MTNFEKIIISLISLLIIVALVFGAIIFRQQKTINAFAKNTATASNQAAVQIPAKKSPSLAETIKQFSGKVESISGNQLIVSINLNDFSKPKDPDKMKNTSVPVNLNQDDFEIVEKKITVNTNDKTFFPNKKLADLKAGDIISIASDKSPYTSDTVMAEKVTYNPPPSK